MSKYTTEVRYICEHYAGLDESKGFNDVAQIIETARPKVFDFDFPIFDESYRSVLETKILKHYYTREIGAESVGLWKLWLDTKLNEIMPYYNQLYQSALIEFNPMNDTDITTDKAGGVEGNKTDNNITTETINRDVSGQTSTTSTNTQNNNSWDYYSDTPQGGLNGIEGNTNLTNVTHQTNAIQNNSSGSGSTTTDDDVTRNKTDNNNGTFKNTESWLEHITGKRGTLSYSKMLQEYRDTFLNIDMKVIDELKDLFMNVW